MSEVLAQRATGAPEGACELTGSEKGFLFSDSKVEPDGLCRVRGKGVFSGYGRSKHCQQSFGNDHRATQTQASGKGAYQEQASILGGTLARIDGSGLPPDERGLAHPPFCRYVRSIVCVRLVGGDGEEYVAVACRDCVASALLECDGEMSVKQNARLVLARFVLGNSIFRNLFLLKDKGNRKTRRASIDRQGIADSQVAADDCRTNKVVIGELPA